jgi:prophage tail gpP-like protein
MPNPQEVAQLIVNDSIFEDWETVWVQTRWSDGWPLFRFTAAEYSPVPAQWGALQFKPGDSCTIKLGGQLGVTGIILTRQTAYDANNHQVELSGAGRTWAAGTSSVPVKKANFDGMTVQGACSKAYGEYGVAVLPVGTADPTPFPKCQAQPGETVFDFCDKLCRMRGATLGSDELGNMLLIGDHSYSPNQDLVEGKNIKKMQCIISNEMMAAIYNAVGQGSNAEELSPAQAAKMEAEVKSGYYKGYYKFVQTVLEHPVMNITEVQRRVYHELKFRDGTLVRAFVTVQGWLRDGVNLWRTGDDVNVNAPMAMLKFVMKIQTATFQQDNQGGTTTVLELVMPWMLSDKPFAGIGNPADADPVTVAPDITQVQPM